MSANDEFGDPRSAAEKEAPRADEAEQTAQVAPTEEQGEEEDLMTDDPEAPEADAAEQKQQVPQDEEEYPAD